MPLWPRNVSSFTMELPLATILSSNKCFFSMANDWSCTILNNRSYASWSALKYIESCNWFMEPILAILFKQISLFLISRAITLFLLLQFQVNLWSCTKTPTSTWTALTCILAGISLKMLHFFWPSMFFASQEWWNFKPLLIFSWCFDFTPSELSSAVLLEVSTWCHCLLSVRSFICWTQLATKILKCHITH